MKNKAAGATPSETPNRPSEGFAAGNASAGLNSSFSAMNNNLSMKWQAK